MSDATRIKPGILPSGATTPIPGAVIEPAPSLPVPVEAAALADAARRRSGIRWGVTLGVSALLLVAGVIVIDAALWLDALFARSAWLGAAAAALFGGVLVALVGFVGGEYRNLLRLRSAQAIREQGYRLSQASGRFEGRGFMNDLLRLTSGNPTGRALCEQYRDAIADTHDDREAMELFERIVLRPLDETAYAAVRRAARDTAIGASVSPVAGIDALIVLWRSLRMVREVAQVYGLRPTRLSVLALVRRMFVTATFAVTADVVGDVLGAHLGGRLAGLVSGKLAEGVFAGVRTARLGLLAIEQCRPLPFAADDRPNLRQLVAQSLGSLLPAPERSLMGSGKPPAAAS
ncbi:MAG: TIGR01620 family protein [Dongiaceae bacterium]